jgi:hypothetical protein
MPASITISGTQITFPDATVQTTAIPAPGTAGNVATSNGTAWTSVAAASFTVGTRSIFAQTTAPTGWTKDTTNYDNHALRVVTGTASTGGTVNFTTAFVSQAVSGSVNTAPLSAGATTLSTAQIPSHTHSYTDPRLGGGPNGAGGGSNKYDSPANTGTTGATGGGGSHSHSVSGSATFTGTAINLAVKYLDVITATKN